MKPEEAMTKHPQLGIQGDQPFLSNTLLPFPTPTIWLAFCAESKLVFRMIYQLKSYQASLLQTTRLDMESTRKLGELTLRTPAKLIADLILPNQIIGIRSSAIPPRNRHE
jgi:hypothetical protein